MDANLKRDIILEHYQNPRNKGLIDDNTYMLDGSMTIYEASKVLDVFIPEGDYDTLSGFILESLGRIPKEKENGNVKVETKYVIFTVEEIEDRRIALVKAEKKDQSENIEDEESDEDDSEKNEIHGEPR